MTRGGAGFSAAGRSRQRFNTYKYWRVGPLYILNFSRRIIRRFCDQVRSPQLIELLFRIATFTEYSLFYLDSMERNGFVLGDVFYMMGFYSICQVACFNVVVLGLVSCWCEQLSVSDRCLKGPISCITCLTGCPVFPMISYNTGGGSCSSVEGMRRRACTPALDNTLKGVRGVKKRRRGSSARVNPLLRGIKDRWDPDSVLTQERLGLMIGLQRERMMLAELKLLRAVEVVKPSVEERSVERVNPLVERDSVCSSQRVVELVEPMGSGFVSDLTEPCVAAVEKEGQSIVKAVEHGDESSALALRSATPSFWALDKMAFDERVGFSLSQDVGVVSSFG